MRKTTDLEYFQYLANRSRVSFMFRRFMYKPVLKQLSGRMLDVGCGIGEFLEIYRESYGIDTNTYCVKYCREKGLNCTVGSAYKIPHTSDSFDSVIFSHVLEHLDKPDTAISEIDRVLKVGGKLIIIVPSERGYKSDPTHVTFWSASNLSQLLQKHGFRIERTSYWPTPFNALNNITTLGETRIVAVKTIKI